MECNNTGVGDVYERMGKCGICKVGIVGDNLCLAEQTHPVSVWENMAV